MNESTGLLLIGYARSNEILKSLRMAITVGLREIIVWIDGAKNENVVTSQMLLINAINGIRSDFPSVRIRIYRATMNFGAGASVLAATTLLFNQFKYGLILEDDLVVDATFFTATKKALLKIENYDEIWMATGTRLMSDNLQAEWEVMNYPVAWGWGTTAEKWSSILVALKTERTFANISNKRIRNYWTLGFRRSMNGEIDAWDIPLAGIMRNLGKQCAIPPVNLVTNLGYDKFATHTKEEIWPLGIPRVSVVPQEISVNQRTVTTNNQFYESKVFKIRHHHRFSYIYGPLLRFIKIRKPIKRPSLVRRVDEALNMYEEL
jgi:hypothetical protein